jgi:hypothetical protein
MIKALSNYFTQSKGYDTNRKEPRWDRIGAWAYTFMGIVTFAHIWHTSPVVGDSYQCIQDHETPSVEACGRDVVGSGLAAAIGGVAWPLVVAVEAYDAVVE